MRSRRVSLETSLSHPHVVQHSSPKKISPLKITVTTKNKGHGKKSETVRRQEVQTVKAGTSGTSSGTSRKIQLGESDLNNFAEELLSLVKQLKEGQLGPFSKLMASVMTKQGPDEGSVRKAESLPNVHLAEKKILGSVTELPRDFIPVDKSCRACVLVLS